MNIERLVKTWFEKWENGKFMEIPVSDDFKHSSPFGTVNGKSNYLDVVNASKEAFLGHRFTLLDELYEGNKACVRYRADKGEFSFEATEWYYSDGELITEIISYYDRGN